MPDMITVTYKKINKKDLQEQRHLFQDLHLLREQNHHLQQLVQGPLQPSNSPLVEANNTQAHWKITQAELNRCPINLLILSISIQNDKKASEIIQLKNSHISPAQV
jgi:hypothetical protein